MASRIVLITGANSGVGYATTKVLTTASKDFHVIMAGRSIDKVKTAASEIESSDIKGAISALQLDVTDANSIKAAAKEVEEKHGHIDALINNAAVGTMDPDIKTRLLVSFETNVIGPALISEAFRPLLLKSSNPYSIFVSSAVGSMTMLSEQVQLTKGGSYDKMPYEEGYRTSKAALNMIAVMEHRDHKEEGLKVFAMCPGFVVSNLRGTSDKARTGGGNAGDPATSGNLVLSILEGKRDADVGKFVQKDGTYPW